ncbi:MAG: hypothetical protein WC580_10405, partial [Agrococcus sp.]
MSDQRRDDFDALIAEAIARADAEHGTASASAQLPEEDVEVVEEQRADDDPVAVFRPADSLPAFEVDDATFAAAANPYEPVEAPGLDRAPRQPSSGWSLSSDVAAVPTVQMDAVAVEAEPRAANQDVRTDARDAATRVRHAVSPGAAVEEPAPVAQSAPEATTEGEPAPLPVPQPKPEPVRVPEPAPEPEPVPVPEPEPEPVPEPEPE